MAPRTLGWIRQFHRPDTPDGVPLLIFPHAGSGASAYRELSKALSAGSGCGFNVLVIQYPGRQDRAGEPALGSLPDIAAGAFEEFAASEHHRGVPIVAFGHSMGGWVAFEFARIAATRGLDVRQLTVSASVPPSRAADKPPHPTDDDAILAHLGALEGTTSAVFANPDLIRLALPVIKADYRACDAYAHPAHPADPAGPAGPAGPAEARIAAPIHAIGGDADPIVTLADLYGWGAHTDSVEVSVFDGGHFFLNDHLDAVAKLLSR